MEQLQEDREHILKETAEVLSEYNDPGSKLIPVLQQIQERLGYLPSSAMENIAETLRIPAVDIYELATFYNQFRLNPPGEYHIKVCLGTACYMAGGDVALDSFQRRLGIKEGETTPDGKFSLERAACLGCCSLAPVVEINEKIEGHVTPTRVDGLLLFLQGLGSHGAVYSQELPLQENQE